MDGVFLPSDRNVYLRQLTEELERRFPQLNPTPGQSLAEVMYKAGQRSVIEYLKNPTE